MFVKQTNHISSSLSKPSFFSIPVTRDSICTSREPANSKFCCMLLRRLVVLESSST